MARLPIQNPQTATGSNKQVFGTLQRTLGIVPNMARVMGNAPAVLQAWAQLLVQCRLYPRSRVQGSAARPTFMVGRRLAAPLVTASLFVGMEMRRSPYGDTMP